MLTDIGRAATMTNEKFDTFSQDFKDLLSSNREHDLLLCKFILKLRKLATKSTLQKKQERYPFLRKGPKFNGSRSLSRFNEVVFMQKLSSLVLNACPPKKRFQRRMAAMLPISM
jgi:hypothetical protein